MAIYNATKFAVTAATEAVMLFARMMRLFTQNPRYRARMSAGYY
jgi:hypothetical protein